MSKVFTESWEWFLNLLFAKREEDTRRVRVVKSILWFFVGLATAIALVRFTRGLGAVTNLDDVTPWGLWIGFDVVSGVALAAGGFVIAAVAYVFHMHEYHSITRPAILTAFLGYIAVAVGLIFDLGIPYNIWRPTLFWQHHSALFEVAWCVMIYLGVLALEFAPTVLENSPFPKLFAFLKKMTLPLVILGIMISTLHQSSLGTLFLIMPFRLHPLWYSELLPLQFFISAVGLGIGMVTMESLLSSWLYRKEPEIALMARLAGIVRYVLALNIAILFWQLISDGKTSFLFEGSWETALFWFEVTLTCFLPLILFSIPRVRCSVVGLSVGAASIVFGTILNRINVSGISNITITGTTYFPSWMEFAVSLGVVSGAILVFMFFVENFNVYPDSEEKEVKISVPSSDPVSSSMFASPWAGGAVINSLVYVVAIAIGLFMIPNQSLSGSKPDVVKVSPVKTVLATKKPVVDEKFMQVVLSKDVGRGNSGRVHMINGNRDDNFVLFDHDTHIGRQNENCSVCHHMNNIADEATPCSQCHSDMYSDTDIFDHDHHADSMGGNSSCYECHDQDIATKTQANTKTCVECHKDFVSSDSIVSTQTPNPRTASSYNDAMHGLCVGCHEREMKNSNDLGDNFPRCSTCHDWDQKIDMRGVKGTAKMNGE